MKTTILIGVFLLAVCCKSVAQAPRSGSGAPSGSCSSGGLYTDITTGNLYSCKGGTWQIAGGSLPTGTDTGVPNSYVVNPSPAVALTIGTSFNFTSTNPNTGASTMNASGTGVKNLYGFNTGAAAALTSGAILSGVTYQATWDGQEWLLGGWGNVGAAKVDLSKAYVMVSSDANGVIGSLTCASQQPTLSRMTCMRFTGVLGQQMGIGYDNDGVFWIGTGSSRFAFLTNSDPEIFAPVSLIDNEGGGGTQLLIQPSAAKTAGYHLQMHQNSGTVDFDVDYQGNVTSGASGAAHLNATTSNNDTSGTLTCSGSTATKTFAVAYTSTPIVVLTDQTTAGGARASPRSNTGFTVTCAGATDVVDYWVRGNPN